MNLRDAFSSEFKQNYADQSIMVGSVFRVFVTDTTPPKVKYIIVVGIEETRVLYATVFINSEINVNVLNRPHLQALQYPLYVANYNFLSNDSYADCSKLSQREMEEMKSVLVEKPHCLVGNLADDDKNNIIQLLSKTITIEGHIKAKYNLVAPKN